MCVVREFWDIIVLGPGYYGSTVLDVFIAVAPTLFHVCLHRQGIINLLLDTPYRFFMSA